MKKLALIVFVLLSNYLTDAQDLLGNTSSEVKKTVKEIKGIKISKLGDSTLELVNNKTQRVCRFKFDSKSSLCTREELQFTKDDFIHLRVVKNFFNIYNSADLNNIKLDSTYRKEGKTFKVTKEGDLYKVALALQFVPTKIQGDIQTKFYEFTIVNSYQEINTNKQ